MADLVGCRSLKHLALLDRGRLARKFRRTNYVVHILTDKFVTGPVTEQAQTGRIDKRTPSLAIEAENRFGSGIQQQAHAALAGLQVGKRAVKILLHLVQCVHGQVQFVGYPLGVRPSLEP